MTALSLTGVAARGLAAGDPEVLAALGDVHADGRVDLVVLGEDAVSFDGADPTHSVVTAREDPLPGVVAHHRRYPSWRFLVVARPARDHPYNLARRVLGAAHLTGGRIGVLLAGDAGPGPWTDAPTDELVDDAAAVVRALWRSWPAGTILGDRERGVYADTSGIRRIDHDGVWRVAGPSPTPAAEHGEPLLGSWGRAAAWADVAVVDGVLLRADDGSIGRIHTAESPGAIRAVPARPGGTARG